MGGRKLLLRDIAMALWGRIPAGLRVTQPQSQCRRDPRHCPGQGSSNLFPNTSLKETAHGSAFQTNSQTEGPTGVHGSHGFTREALRKPRAIWGRE